MVRPTNPSLVAVVHPVALLSFVVLLAMIGLMAADNWPKVLRVGLAFGGYAAVMLAGVFFVRRVNPFHTDSLQSPAQLQG